MKDELDIFDEDNKVLKEIYNQDNYKVIEKNIKSRKCLIFFSSNGLYFPNTTEIFFQRIVKEDRYEWSNVMRSAQRLEKWGKIIYVRDIRKQWYITGINSRINSITQLKTLLEEITQNYEVFTVGNSAGGYIATLMGILLKAKAIFNFSGQFDLHYTLASNPYLDKYMKKDSYRYCNLIPFIVKSATPIFYFFPASAELDVKQYALVKELDNVYSFAINENSHGSTILPMNYQYVFSMPLDILVKLCKHYQGKQIDKKEFLLRTAGVIRAVLDYGKFKIGKSVFNKGNL